MRFRASNSHSCWFRPSQAAASGIGGTYEHGYRLLHPLLGFSAGWLYLWAKSASAATAALALAGYVLTALDLNDPLWRIGLGLVVVVIVDRDSRSAASGRRC